MIDTRREEPRIEQQLERLRNRLATAWERGCSPRVIHRLEMMIDRRWKLRDRAATKHRPLQPA